MIQVFVLESKDEREKKSDCRRGAVTVALGQELTPTPALARPANSQRIPPPIPPRVQASPSRPAGARAGGSPGGEAGGGWHGALGDSGTGFNPPQKLGHKPLPVCGPGDGGPCLVAAGRSPKPQRPSPALPSEGCEHALTARGLRGAGDGNGTASCSLNQLTALAPRWQPREKRKL